MKQPTRARPALQPAGLLERLPPRQQALIAAARTVAERQGLAVYLVGGPVRDLLLGSPSTDLDLAVAGAALPYANVLAASLGARLTVHPRFGTATLAFQDGLRLDVATARRERYPHPAALPQVEAGTIEEDLGRRDFTVNAMAVRLDARQEELLDPFGGLADLEAGLLRSLHGTSYRDDPTRILRGARYAARCRLRFAEQDRRLIRTALEEGVLRRLSADRLFRELKLLLAESRPEAALRLLEDLAVLRTLDPALTFGAVAAAALRGVRRGLKRYRDLGVGAGPPPWRVALLVLLRAVPVRVLRRVAGRLGMKGALLAHVLAELRDLPRLERQLSQERIRPSRLRRLLDGTSPEVHLLLWAVSAGRARQRVERYLTHLASVRPALTGRDFKDLGIPPGPAYRRIMALLLDGRLEGRLGTREDEVAFVRHRFGRARPAARRVAREHSAG